MEKSTREKLIVITIILLLPCLFYENNNKNIPKEIKSEQLTTQKTSEQVSGNPATTSQASNSESYVSPYAQENIYPAVQNNSMQSPNIPSNYNYVNNIHPNTPTIEELRDDALDSSDYILTDNYANLKLKYHYYIPNSILKNKNLSYPLIVAVPGLSGGGESLLTPEFKDFAQKEGFGIVAPTFIEDTNNFDSQKSYQYPAAWSGDAMIRIIKALESKGIRSSKLYLFGFSAGAQFVSRFSLIHPEMVAACAMNSSGARVAPTTNNGVKYYIAIGNQDTPYRIENAEMFYKASKQFNIPVVYKQYNEGHTYGNEQILDELNFFKKVKNGNL